MYTLIVENSKGEKLELTHNPAYSILSVEGLTPAAANINTAVMGTFDGEKFNSSRVGMRNIVITAKVNYPAEQNRIALYGFFRPKQPCRLYYKNGTRDVYIDGYTETFDGSLFELSQQMQISIICPQPYFLLAAKGSSAIARITSLFEFPFSIAKQGISFSEINTTETTTITNNGDVDIGLTIELIAKNGSVVNPIIYNADTRESFALNNTTLLDGDIITIDTNKGEKKITLTRSGVTTNIISQIAARVDWFQIPSGDTVFTFSCDSGEEFLQINFSINEKYQGV